MDEAENPPPLSVEEAAEQTLLFSRFLCPFYDSEPESETNSDLSILSDDDDYHSLPPSPMAPSPSESDQFPVDSSQDFFDSFPMETDTSFYDEFESDRDTDLVEWIETERASGFSLDVASELGDDMDADRYSPESVGLPDPTVMDSDELQISSFEVESDLQDTFPADDLLSRVLDLEEAVPDPDWADTVEFSAFREMDTDTSQVPRPSTPEDQFILDNSDLLNECFPEQYPNPSQHPNPEPDPDWEVASTDSSSLPDIEEIVRNMEFEVLLAMHNIYEGDPEMEFFRQLLELDRAVRGAPPTSGLALESLPNITADESMVDLQCAVCKEFVLVGESLKRLPCLHDYHASCILPWLGIRNTCPLCRFELPTDDQNYESWRARQETQV